MLNAYNTFKGLVTFSPGWQFAICDDILNNNNYRYNVLKCKLKHPICAQIALLLFILNWCQVL